MVIKSVATSANEQPPSWYTPVTGELLQQITQRIVDALGPEKIILFGSYAYGKPTIHSDVDLLVITNKMAKQSTFARTRAVSDLFPQRRFGMDVLVRTPQAVKRRLALGDDFLQDIIEHGSVLYERRQRRRVDSGSRNRLQKRARSRAAT